jgi:hypothetical protein
LISPDNYKPENGFSNVIFIDKRGKYFTAKIARTWRAK